MNTNHLIVISKYPEEDYRAAVFRDYISPRNEEFCQFHGIKYHLIDNRVDLEVIRGRPIWWKFSVILDMMKDGRIKDGDNVIHYDADIFNVKPEVSLFPPQGKSFAYAIDSGNTHCMGFCSLKVNEWSKKLVSRIMCEERWERTKDIITKHDRFGTYSSFVREFGEQAMIYLLFGIKRHSDKSFWSFPNNGWHSEVTDEVRYTLKELKENVHIFPTEYNVTEWPLESSLEFNINPVNCKENVVLRHLTGANWFNVTNWV